jgi:hypothetical protein
MKRFVLILAIICIFTHNTNAGTLIGKESDPIMQKKVFKNGQEYKYYAPRVLVSKPTKK